jgi:hypothetical protein
MAFDSTAPLGALVRTGLGRLASFGRYSSHFSSW